MSAKEELREVSQQLNKASKLHKQQSEKVAGLAVRSTQREEESGSLM
tara:strand:+ start:638 stop:778 length:141 start_codon:yes stop_codon:yes gene_type:complete